MDRLQPGDVLVKKVFPETRKGAVEWLITTGEGWFEGDHKLTVGRLMSREKSKVAFLGSHTSEHAAVALSADEIAEAVGEGVITASVRGRRAERYIAYRCLKPDLGAAATQIARGLSNAYHCVVTAQPRGATTGGKYATTAAFTSLMRNTGFQGDRTRQFLDWVVEYVYGMRPDRPNMFCSEFAVTCYEAGSVAAFGRTAFGSNPHAVSPMELENILNGRPELFTLVGKYDSENDRLFAAVESGLKTYGARWHWNQSDASKEALSVLHNLLEIGDNEYILAYLAALLDLRPTGRVTLRCVIRDRQRLKKDSQFYRDLTGALTSTGVLASA